MREEKKLTRMAELMKEHKVSMRDAAAYTGTQLTLICYIVNGFAKFPTEAELNKFCELLKCKPTDLYPKRTLQAMYPKTVPKRPTKPRTHYGNPSVRVRAELVEQIKSQGKDVSAFVNKAVEAYINQQN